MSDRDGHPLLHPTRIDIPSEIRLDLMSLLNQTLACTVDLRSQVTQASWKAFSRTLLDHVVVVHERHLRWLLTEYFQHYYHWRTHRALDMDCPVPRTIQQPEVRLIKEVPEVGGLHHHDERRGA